MSSHHIVRDAQEPALIIAGDFSREHIEALLECCLAEVLSWDIKIDVVVSSLEQAPTLSLKLEHQFPVKIILDKPDALTAALAYLNANGHLAANIVGKSPSVVAQDLLAKMTLIFYKEDYKYISPLQSHFKKWVAAGTTFLIDTPADKIILKVKNLHKKELNWEVIEHGFVEISHLPLHSWIGEKIY